MEASYNQFLKLLPTALGAALYMPSWEGDAVSNLPILHSIVDKQKALRLTAQTVLNIGYHPKFKSCFFARLSISC
jgi:hypothetical protein